MGRWRIATTVTTILRCKKIPFLENAPSWGPRWDTSPTGEGAGVVAMVKNTHDYQPQWVLRGVKLGNLPAAGVWRWWAGGGRSGGGRGGSIQSGWGGNGGSVQCRGMVFGWCSLTRSCPVTFELWLTDANAWCGRRSGHFYYFTQASPKPSDELANIGMDTEMQHDLITHMNLSWWLLWELHSHWSAFELGYWLYWWCWSLACTWPTEKAQISPCWWSLKY